jgi:FkbM family methyltransferase
MHQIVADRHGMARGTSQEIKGFCSASDISIRCHDGTALRAISGDIELNAQLERKLKTFARRIGLELSRARPTVASLILSRQVDCVFDAGAHRGEFAQSLRAAGYAARIVSFEPVLSTFEILKLNAASDGRWVVNNYALGAASGVGSINVAARTEFSSILPTTTYADEYHPGASVVREEQVKIERFDDVYPKLKGSRNFLKVDAQGFEPSVLKGAEAALSDLVGVQLELPCTNLYANSWSFAEGIAFMAAKGFALAQTTPVLFSVEDPQRLVDLDCVFVKSK